MNRLLTIMFFCTFSILYSSAQSNIQKLVITDSSEYYDLAPYSEIYADTVGDWTIDSAKSKQTDSKFWKLKKKKDSKRYADPKRTLSKVWWNRFKVANSTHEGKGYLLDIGADSAMFYYSINGKYYSKEIRMGKSAGKKEVKSSDNFYLPLNIDSNYCYINFYYSEQVDYHPIEIKSTTLEITSFYNKLIYVLFAGALLMMAVYHIILYFSMFEISYIYYTIYLLFFGLLVSTRAYDSDWIDSIMPILVPGIPVSYMLFGRSFLKLKETLPKWNSIVNYLLIGLIVPLVLSYAEDYLPIGPQLANIMGAISIVGFLIAFFIIIVPAIICWKKGVDYAKFIVFGNGLLLAGMIGGLICQFTIGGYSLYYGGLLGGFAEVVVFANGLGFKIREITKEKEQAQEKALAHLEEKVKERTVELQAEKDKVEAAHREITDSIDYAERIQYSFLATKEMLDKNLGEYFVFFRPKDVVSGDFYWVDKLSNGNFAIVNADSTGHGVPGAIMSILNISSIERAVEHGALTPAAIFNQARSYIIERLKKDGSEHGGKDGMDASIVCFNADKSKMTYTAAQNPIWVIRDGEVIQIKAEKMPVGKHDNDHVPFIGGEFDLQRGDQVYTLTDGFQDQFGGPKGKKFMIKKMREYVLSISHLSMQEQYQKLDEVFSNWKADLEQVDDVCVIGIRV